MPFWPATLTLPSVGAERALLNRAAPVLFLPATIFFAVPAHHPGLLHLACTGTPVGSTPKSTRTHKAHPQQAPGNSIAHSPWQFLPTPEVKTLHSYQKRDSPPAERSSGVSPFCESGFPVEKYSFS